MARGAQLVLVACMLAAGVAHAQPGAGPRDVATVLHDANTSASAGDWARVDALVEPLLLARLAPGDLAEAHRLAGLSAFFAQHRAAAEAHFLAYLEIDLDGRLDPSLVPPEAVTFFEEVRVRHAAELRARRPHKPSGLWTLLPPITQFQTGHRVKGAVIGGALLVFLAADITTYAVLESWCSSSTDTCDQTTNHTRAARDLRTINLISGITFLATYVYGVYDSVVAYRRAVNEQYLPYASIVDHGAVVGVGRTF
jgi:hypothetical protein